eukprot:FR741243.1.p1 GENE.FR741243.1~~FR741243.1.p1  ORF type:complete len:341 (+),score=52.38 FR741243.1:50-1024(+)
MTDANIGTWPTCASHFKLTNVNASNDRAVYETYDKWAWDVGYVPHGPVHEYIGGLGGDCSKWQSLLDRGYINSTQLAGIKMMAFNVLKNLWREEMIETPKYCAADTPVSECMWQCKADFSSSDDVSGEMSIMGFHAHDNPDVLPSAANLANYDFLVNSILCETAFWPGDHLEAASPIEASFWPIHPTIDRLLQYHDMVTPFIVDGWGRMLQDDDNNSSPHEWDTSELCSDKSNGTALCYGHNAYDVTYFRSTHHLSNGSYTQNPLSQLESETEPKGPKELMVWRISYTPSNFKHCQGRSSIFTFKKISWNQTPNKIPGGRKTLP